MAIQKRGRKAKDVTPQPIDALDQADDDEIDSDPDQLPWEEDLTRWAMEEKYEGEYYRLVLFRRRESGKGKEKVWEWIDENPGSHEIGLMFGGGPYTAYMLLPRREGEKPRIKTRHFILADSYSERKKLRDRENGLSPMVHQGHPYGQQQAPQPQVNEMERLALIFEKMVFPMMELMGRNQAAAPVAQDPMKYFPGMATMMTDVVMQGARSQIALTKELVKEMATGNQGKAQTTDPDDEEEANDFDYKEFLKDALKEYGPTILEAVGLKAKAAASMIKSNEVFQTLAQNKSLFDRVLGLLKQDQDVDHLVVDKVLDKLSKLGVGFNVRPLPPVNGNGAAHESAMHTGAHGQ